MAECFAYTRSRWHQCLATQWNVEQLETHSKFSLWWCRLRCKNGTLHNHLTVQTVNESVWSRPDPWRHQNGQVTSVKVEVLSITSSSRSWMASPRQRQPGRERRRGREVETRALLSGPFSPTTRRKAEKEKEGAVDRSARERRGHQKCSEAADKTGGNLWS